MRVDGSPLCLKSLFDGCVQVPLFSPLPDPGSKPTASSNSVYQASPTSNLILFAGMATEADGDSALHQSDKIGVFCPNCYADSRSLELVRHRSAPPKTADDVEQILPNLQTLVMILSVCQYMKPRAERICPCYDSEQAEDEKHCVLECPAYDCFGSPAKIAVLFQ